MLIVSTLGVVILGSAQDFSDYNFTNPDLGIFIGHQDIGFVRNTQTPLSEATPGKVGRKENDWVVVGSGWDMWKSSSAFHFLYLKTEGDFRMSIEKVYIEGYGDNPSYHTWAKVGVLACQDLTPGAAHAYGLIRGGNQGDNATFQGLEMQWREQPDGSCDENDACISWEKHNATIILVRKGDVFYTYWVDQTGKENLFEKHTIKMTGSIYVGVAVVSHIDGAYSAGSFSNPKFEKLTTAVSDWSLM